MFWSQTFMLGLILGAAVVECATTARGSEATKNPAELPQPVWTTNTPKIPIQEEYTKLLDDLQHLEEMMKNREGAPELQKRDFFADLSKAIGNVLRDGRRFLKDVQPFIGPVLEIAKHIGKRDLTELEKRNFIKKASKSIGDFLRHLRPILDIAKMLGKRDMPELEKRNFFKDIGKTIKDVIKHGKEILPFITGALPLFLGKREREPPMPEREPTMPEKEPPMPEREPPMPEREPPMPEREPPMPEREPTMPEREPPMPEDDLSVEEKRDLVSDIMEKLGKVVARENPLHPNAGRVQ